MAITHANAEGNMRRAVSKSGQRNHDQIIFHFRYYIILYIDVELVYGNTRACCSVSIKMGLLDS